MKNGILIIAGVWFMCNLLGYIIDGLEGAVISTYCCAAVVWFGRKKLIRYFKI